VDEKSQIQRFESATEKLDRALEFYQEVHKPLPNSNSSASNIHVNAGGLGIWVCSTFCALCLMASLFTLYVVSEIKQNDRDQGNQLNAIYMMAPHLKPEKNHE